MGEVRVKVKISNYIDQVLVQRGLLPQEGIRCYEAEALVDTGSVSSVIPQQVVDALGLPIRGKRIAEYADGRTDLVDLAGGAVFEIIGRDTEDEAFVVGNDVLIGQTVLEKLDLLVDCKNQRVIPNPVHPDQPVLRI